MILLYSNTAIALVAKYSLLLINYDYYCLLIDFVYLISLSTKNRYKNLIKRLHINIVIYVAERIQSLWSLNVIFVIVAI